MIADVALQADLQQALSEMARLPLLSLLEHQGILLPLVRQLLLERLRQMATSSPAQIEQIARQICAELATGLPANLEGNWTDQLPEGLRAQARQRWNQQRLQIAVEARYGDRLESYYITRRANLDQVVFRMMRLDRQGVAEELYLRLIDDGASFGDLAESHALGEERHTRGLVGPMAIGQPHPSIGAVLARLLEGEIHPPFLVDQTILLVRLEKRLPAQLTAPIRQQLLQELLDAELESCAAVALAELHSSSAAKILPGSRQPELALSGRGN